MKLFLTGFMGAGKSEVGSRLAAKMGIDFVDLDSMIEDEAKLPVAGIFETGGEGMFRQLEHESLRALCGSDRDLVVSTGGGTPTFERNLDLIRSSGLSLWIDPSIEVILARLEDEGRVRRPLFGSEAEVRALFDRRRPAYGSANLRVRPGANEMPDETAENIVELLSKQGAGVKLAAPARGESP